jgi:plastocyanin
MRRSLRITRAVVALVGSAGLMAFAFAPGSATAEDQTVTVGTPTANVYTPKQVTIDVGDTVTWRWGGGFGHTVSASSGNWAKDDPVGPPTASLSTTHTFDKAGTFTYLCKTHGESMAGSVVVRGGSKPKPTTKPPTTRPPSGTPTATRTSTTSARPSASAGSATPTPEPSAGSATPVVPGTTGRPTPARSSGAPLPTIAGGAEASPFLGEGGLTPPPATGREKGLPVMLALLLIGGVGSAELRALLAVAPE